MQFTQAESTIFTRVSVEDIKTQSASRPEIMKKFIKSKIDHNKTTSRSTPTYLADPPPKIGREKKMPDVQPPLPLDPPPPDEKPNLTLELKQEIDDNEYQIPGEESSETLNHEEVSGELNGVEETDTSKPKPMCRDFIRGRCTRPGTCKFSHKCDVSQLVGVYTFCRNFQNCVCTLPNCKYVHATVFEEQHFYRTGELPPHALAHHKKVNILPPPPPPPPEEARPTFNNPPPPMPAPTTSVVRPSSVISVAATERSNDGDESFRSCINIARSSPIKRDWAQKTPPTFDNPPPPMPAPTTSIVRPSSVISVAATERSNDGDESFRSCINIARSSTIKRDWAQIGRAARVLEASGHVPKKCKNCEVTEFRFRYNQDRLDCVKHLSVELSKKILEVDEKIAKVMSIMTTIIKAKAPPNISSGGDGHKDLMEQINNMLSNEIQSRTDEHTTIYHRNIDMSNLLATLLTPPSGDQKPDVSHTSVL